jgi:hypothetical protein
MIEASRNQQREGRPGRRLAVHLPRQKAVLAGLLVALVALGSVAIYQQEQILSLKHQLIDGTVEIGGVMYWTEVFPVPVPNGTSIRFHGVMFTSLSPSFENSYSDPSNFIFAGAVRLSNGTLLNLTGQSVEIRFNFRVLDFLTQNGTTLLSGFPPTTLAVSFPSGEREVYGGYTVTAVHASADYNIPHDFTILNVTYHPEVVNPWFTEHAGPEAGIFWNFTSNELTFYVSTH